MPFSKKEISIDKPEGNFRTCQENRYSTTCTTVIVNILRVELGLEKTPDFVTVLWELRRKV